MSMTPESKRELSSTIRSLRTRLLSDLHDATESAYRLSVHERDAGLVVAQLHNGSQQPTGKPHGECPLLQIREARWNADGRILL